MTLRSKTSPQRESPRSSCRERTHALGILAPGRQGRKSDQSNSMAAALPPVWTHPPPSLWAPPPPKQPASQVRSLRVGWVVCFYGWRSDAQRGASQWSRPNCGLDLQAGSLRTAAPRGSSPWVANRCGGMAGGRLTEERRPRVLWAQDVAGLAGVGLAHSVDAVGSVGVQHVLARAVLARFGAGACGPTGPGCSLLLFVQSRSDGVFGLRAQPPSPPALPKGEDMDVDPSSPPALPDGEDMDVDPSSPPPLDDMDVDTGPYTDGQLWCDDAPLPELKYSFDTAMWDEEGVPIFHSF